MKIPFLEPGADASSLPWKSTRVEGIAWLPLSLDDEGSSRGATRGGGAVLIRMEPGCGYTPHRHLGPEHVLVLAGGYRDELGSYRRGETVHYPRGSSHAPVALDEPGPGGEPPEACILYAVAVGGVELIEGPVEPSVSSPNPDASCTIEDVKVTTPIDGLIQGLTSAFEGGHRSDEVVRLLKAYIQEHDDWRQYATWSDERYTRNQLARTDRFELLLLCWGANQTSPIHNHEGQHCWMGVLEGTIEELRYCCPDEVRPGPLEPRDQESFEAGQVAFIQDEIGLHVVRSGKGRPGVSLHLYASPYDECNVYCPETGRLTRKQLSNDTIREA